MVQGLSSDPSHAASVSRGAREGRTHTVLSRSSSLWEEVLMACNSAGKAPSAWPHHCLGNSWAGAAWEPIATRWTEQL